MGLALSSALKIEFLRS